MPDYAFGQSGGLGVAWSLALNPDIVSMLNVAGLFNRGTSGPLAFEVKAGSNWAVYDFDFNRINLATKPDSMSGAWNLNDFRTP